MATSKRSRKKATKRPRRRQARKAAVTRFTATRTVLTRLPDVAETVWVKLGPIWMKRGGRPGEEVEGVQRMKQAALKALQKFRQG